MRLWLLISVVSFFSSASFAQSPLTLNGDLRFRHDYLSKTNQSDRHRERFRLRIGTQANVNESIKAKVRLTTDEDADPISGNQTMTDNASKKSIFIDLAFVDWQIDDGFNLAFGKQENPFRIIQQSQILYDSDYTPEGLSITRQGSLFVNLGAFSLVERSPNATTGTSEPDSWLVAAMAGYKADLTDSLGFTLAIAHHAFTSLKDHAVFKSQKFYGNSTYGNGDNTRYLYNYSVNELLAELRWKAFGSTANLYADAIQNYEVDSHNQGLIVGANYSTLNDRGKPDWTLGYSYTNVDKDATVSAVNNSDFASGEDGSHGHTFVIGKSIASGTNVQLTWMHASIDNDGAPYDTDRGLFDVSFAF